MPFFDPDAMDRVIDDPMATTEALLFGRRTWQTVAARGRRVPAIPLRTA